MDALVTSGEINVGASATAIISSSGTLSSFDITNAGSGYVVQMSKLVHHP